MDEKTKQQLERIRTMCEDKKSDTDEMWKLKRDIRSIISESLRGLPLPPSGDRYKMG